MEQLKSITATTSNQIHNEQGQQRAIASPILRLRGGGASQLRKALRKRKFDHLELETNQSSEILDLEVHNKVIEHLSQSPHRADRPVESNLNRASECASSPKDQDGNETEPSMQKSGSDKAQRFIAFIGSCLSSKFR